MFLCIFIFKVRTLGCASLVAGVCKSSNTKQLWLIDATGAYRVRAHALGGGEEENKYDDENEENVNINQKLCNYDFLSLSSMEGLQILKDLVIIDSSSSKHNKMECAIIESKNGRLIRI